MERVLWEEMQCFGNEDMLMSRTPIYIPYNLKNMLAKMKLKNDIVHIVTYEMEVKEEQSMVSLKMKEPPVTEYKPLVQVAEFV